ncbi:MAG: hypothetical protein JSU61_02830 [Fidelibacterota bacterium]|nr:MAG: hypothetical protein JSU61_02830 [Candidatus Neomarinimicrobiota bacterium]
MSKKKTQEQDLTAKGAKGIIRRRIRQVYNYPILRLTSNVFNRSEWWYFGSRIVTFHFVIMGY